MEDPTLIPIIRSCHLKPKSALQKGFNFDKTELEPEWLDDFGNVLNISNKKINIVYNSLELDRTKLIITDIHYGKTIKEISQMSQFAAVVCGIEEDFKSNYFNLLFYGNDDILRNYVYIYGTWHKNYSPLMLGYKALQEYFNNMNINYFIESNIEPIYPCDNYNAWLTRWKPSTNFLTELNKTNIELFNIIKEII